jgi:hypothetical protein
MPLQDLADTLQDLLPCFGLYEGSLAFAMI